MSHLKSLRRLLSVLVVALVATLGFTATATAGPHYVKGPDATVVDNSLVITFKAAGLGKTVESAKFFLTGTVTAKAQCYTKSGNAVNGVPKYDETIVNAEADFPVRNGQVTGEFVVAPLTTLTCTGKQVVRILDVSWDLDLYNQYLGHYPLQG